ncbi:TPA: hypothetical protein ROI28_004445 [Citrobacter freundii]|nr:hypothetical protein [Citrobacter freundii]
MIKTKNLLKRKDDLASYDGLTMIWPCVDGITVRMLALLKTLAHEDRVGAAVSSAIKAYHQDIDEELNDWERLAIYIIELGLFVSRELQFALNLHEITSRINLPRKLTHELMIQAGRKARIGEVECLTS